MEERSDIPQSNQPPRKPIQMWPSTNLGEWSVWLGLVFIVLFTVNQTFFMNLAEDTPWRTTLLPFYGIGMLGCGLAAGITGLTAFFRRHERSRLVIIPLLMGALVIFFLLGEFLIPH